VTTQPTINEQIAGALGDARGSYELLIGSHICDALGVEPTSNGRLIPTPRITPQSVEWLRATAIGSGPGCDHAADVLAALQL
jgi:hypothetical protein